MEQSLPHLVISVICTLGNVGWIQNRKGINRYSQNSEFAQNALKGTLPSSMGHLVEIENMYEEIRI